MDDDLSRLIGLIYEAALDHSLWPRVVTGLADVTGGHFPDIAFFDPATVTAVTIAPRTDPDYLRSYDEHWANDPWVRQTPLIAGAASRPVGRVFRLESLVDTEEMVGSSYYHEWWRPQGMGTSGLIATLLADGTGFAFAGVYKPDGETFSEQDMRRFGMAAHHIGHAMQMQRRLHRLDLQNNAAVGALDRLCEGVLLLDDTGRVMFANDCARTLIDAGDLSVDRGHLLAASAGDRLDALVASFGNASCESAGGTLELARGKDRQPLRLTVAPLRTNGTAASVPWLGPRRAAALVTITDPEAEERRRADIIRRRFGLTAAEAALALEIAKGDGRDAAAARRGISSSTAHTHLNRIFEKTGTRRQAELTRLLFACSADGANGEGSP